jgi:hypothetical protein
MSPRGGARPGSGRRPQLVGPVKITFVIEASTLDKIDQWCQTLGLTRSEAIRVLLEQVPRPKR